MINLATRYFDLGQRAFADAVQFNSICFTCAARLTRIQAGAASALFPPTATPPGLWLLPGPAGFDSNGASMAALLKCVDEAYETLADAQSQMRTIVEGRWSELANEMTAAARQLAGDEPEQREAAADRSHRTRPGARQAEPRAAVAGGA